MSGNVCFVKEERERVIEGAKTDSFHFLYPDFSTAESARLTPDCWLLWKVLERLRWKKKNLVPKNNLRIEGMQSGEDLQT